MLDLATLEVGIEGFMSASEVDSLRFDELPLDINRLFKFTKAVGVPPLVLQRALLARFLAERGGMRVLSPLRLERTSFRGDRL